MTRYDILLINTPYSTMGNPYISIPVLHSFLKSQNIDVMSFDLDAHLYRTLAEPENVRKGITHVKKRFLELNSRMNLDFAESVEYRMFATLLFQLSVHGEPLCDFVSRDYAYEEFRQAAFKKLLLTASSATSFPEMIVTVPRFAVNSLFESFSVSEIFRSLSDSNPVTEALYSKIDSILETCDSPVWGFSIPFNDQIIKAFQCAAYVKRKKPDTFIIMGGPAVSMYFRNFPDNRLFSIVDAFAYYEGELTLRSLVNVIKSDGSLHDVPGISFIEGERIHYTPAPEKIPLNDSTVPDYTAFDLDSYIKGRDSMTVPIRLTKGCAWGKCTFCSSYESRYEQIDPAKALDHLLKIYNETGIRHYMFSDEASPLGVLDYLAEKIIELDISIAWIFHTRMTKMLTKERCELYRKAGCNMINIGIESTSDRILKKMNKGITFSQIRNFFDEMETIIPLSVYMMTGFPGEREDEAKDSFNYLYSQIKNKKLTTSIYSLFVVKPESPIWKNPSAFGISELQKRKDLDLDHNVYCFKSDGMPFEKVYELFSLFSGKTRFEQTLSRISVIEFQELHETLGFSMKDVTDFVSSDISFFYGPMRNWFSNPKTISRSDDVTW